MNYNNIDEDNINSVNRDRCCMCCTRHTYAILNMDNKITHTHKEIYNLHNNKVNRNLWNSYVADKLRLQFNICFLLFSVINIVIIYALRASDFVIISNDLNNLHDTNKYSFLEINDVVIVICNVLGLLFCLYATKFWYDKHKMNKYVIIAWSLFTLSTFSQIIIPPYYIKDVFYTIFKNKVNSVVDGFVSDDELYNSNEYRLLQTETSNKEDFGILENILTKYLNIFVKCIIFIVILPFMFRNNAIQISKKDNSYRKIAKVLHIILTITEVFISIIICNIMLVFQLDYYWIAVCIVVCYNLWKQVQYFYNTSIIENILLFCLCVFAVLFLVLTDIPIPYDTFINNFLNSYFINKSAIQSIIYNKNIQQQSDSNNQQTLHVELI